MSIKNEVRLPGIDMNLSSMPYVKIYAEETDKKLLDCISEILKDKQDVNIALSGGLDSQFMLYCCLELNKNITLFTYRSLWEDVVLNSSDIYNTEQLAKKFNLKHHIIDIDLKKFFDNLEHFKYSKDFFNTSPQISVHFHFIKQIKEQFGIQHLILGGDAPTFTYSNFDTGSKIRLTAVGAYWNHVAPYYLFCESIGLECIKDIFYHSKECVYAGFKLNLDVLKNKNIYAITDMNYRSNTYKYKTSYYREIFPDITPQPSAFTGFETLKKILASETGIYNQFDILYRHPQVKLVPEFMANRPKLQKNMFYDSKIIDLYKEFIEYVRQNDCKDVSEYTFDF